MNMYKDIDANFSQNRVDEILKSEGFFPHERKFEQTSLAKSNSLNEFDSKCFRISAQPKMFSISDSRVGGNKKEPKMLSHSAESLAILQSRKKLPTLIISPAGRGKPG